MRRARALALVCALVLLTAACGSLPFLGGGGTTRRVLVDYRHDEFSASFLNYFPNRIAVHAGDTVEFQQMWTTGEAHTVTMGTLVDTLGKPYWDLLDRVRSGKDVKVPETPPDAPGFNRLPVMLDPNDLEHVVQAAAQPCYRDTWVPDVRDHDAPCPKRKQPAFNGRQAYYSSGFIPYEGSESNSFTLPLAGDILEGTYHYYCNYHGPLMSGTIEVVDDDEDIPTQTQVTKEARREAGAYIDELAKVIERQKAGQDAPLPVVGGRPSGDPFFSAFHNEYIPSTVEARVGEKVTWSFYGGHTLSFNVPKYLPVFSVGKDGFVAFNPDAFKPVGWPGRPEQDGPRTAVNVDAGEWDGGGGFRSTGWDFGGPYDGKFDTFSITFTRPGEYPFACLLHPAMVGKVVVR